MAGKLWRNMGWDWRSRVLLTAGLCALGLLAARLEFVRKLEWKTEDARLQARAAWGEAPDGRLLLLGIDEASVEDFGQWPFLRSYHYTLLDWLGRDEATRPAVMAWDILFVDRTYEGVIDQAFAEIVGGLDYPVIFGGATEPAARGLVADGDPGWEAPPLARVSERPEWGGLPDMAGGKLPIPGLLRAGARFGFLDAEADGDGVVRRLPLVIRVGDEVHASLVLRTLLEYWKINYGDVALEPGRALLLRRGEAGTVRVPVDAEGRFALNYRHEHGSTENPGGLPTLGYSRVYLGLQARHLEEAADAPPPPTGGKIVVVGQVASGLTDIGPSPLERKSAKVMVHLNALDNILKGDFRRDLPLAPALAGVLALGLAIGLVLERRKIGFFVAAVGASAVALAIGATGLLLGWSVMMPLAMPLAAFLAQQGAFATLKVREEQAKRDRIRGMFATYVAPALVDKMVQSGEEPRLGGVVEEITAYFSDIESFSSFSEQLPPERLVELMNEYLTACTDIVQAEGGTLDKYIGDAVVAMYGAPLVLPNHGHRAVVAALRVHRRCAELRAKWRAEQAQKGWPDIVTNLQTRIGLNLGKAVVGNMGSHTRFNYTMMGDTVNVAARMESGAKSYGVYTLVTESVVEASRRAEPDAVLFRPLDRIVVKGRSRPAAVFEAMALRADAEADGGRMAECATVFAEGLARYYAQDWTGAREKLRRSLELEAHPVNNPSKVMLARIELMQTHPPAKDWDGVWRMTTK
jgi:adenylate cyclase